MAKGWKLSTLGVQRSKVKVREAKIGQTCEHDISKTFKPILLQVGTSFPWSKGDQL